MTRSKADIHIHTNYSNEDAFSPDQIIMEAQASNVRVISFTDYNSVCYYQENKVNRYEYVGNILVISGVELMCQGYWEILGYCFDPTGPISSFLTNWHQTLHCLLQRALSEVSLPNGLDLAQVTLDFNRYDTGIFCTSESSFLQGTWREAEEYRPSVNKAIEIVKESRGLSFLAHPISVWDLVFHKDYYQMRERLVQLRKDGLDGLEVYQPRLCEKNEEVQDFLRWLKRMANDLGFLVSGGSDFHYRRVPYLTWAKDYGDILATTYERLGWLNEVLWNDQSKFAELQYHRDSLAPSLDTGILGYKND